MPVLLVIAIVFLFGLTIGALALHFGMKWIDRLNRNPRSVPIRRAAALGEIYRVRRRVATAPRGWVVASIGLVVLGCMPFGLRSVLVVLGSPYTMIDLMYLGGLGSLAYAAAFAAGLWPSWIADCLASREEIRCSTFLREWVFCKDLTRISVKQSSPTSRAQLALIGEDQKTTIFVDPAGLQILRDLGWLPAVEVR